ncbi:hypothetical protein AB0I72_20145 [Nocardiopsis sp. NPDC049922]|uniref:hypothetical protein n=1 Tax=Nocardiopsis sp. NPDC049922 TaxID=3155157 RepID=UPI0033F4850A
MNPPTPTPKRRRAARLRLFLPDLSAMWFDSAATVFPLVRDAHQVLREVLR